MSQAGLYAGSIGRDQCAGDSDLLLITEQLIRIVESEGDPDEGRPRSQGDVALLPVEAHPEYLFTVHFFLDDDSMARHRAGSIGTRSRFGQGKTGHLLALRQPRKQAVFLFLGAVMEQQFSRAQRVGNHDGDRQRITDRGRPRDHGRHRSSREAQPSVTLRDDHAEEAMLGQEIEGLFGKGSALPVSPGIGQVNQFLDRTVEEFLLPGGQFRGAPGEPFIPVGGTTEEFSIPAHGSAIECFSFRGADGREKITNDSHHREGQHDAP